MNPKSLNPHARLWSLLVGTTIFALCAFYIAITFDWRQVGSLLLDVNLSCLLFGGTTGIVAYWLIRAVRWNLLLKRLNMHFSPVDLYLCTAVSLTISLITPLQSGEALKVELLRKYGGIRRFEGYSTFLVERACDLAVVAAIAFISLLNSLDLLADKNFAYLGIGALFVGAGIFAAALAKIKPKGMIGEFIACVRECASKPGLLASVLALTLAGWIVVGLTWQVLLYSLGLNLGFRNAMALTSVMTFINILSLVPGALGVAEAGAAEILIKFGYHTVLAQAGAILLRSYSLIALPIGAIHYLAWILLRARSDAPAFEKVR
jgi:uncharacterized membrane protein YbhN (UPF0104 family)